MSSHMSHDEASTMNGAHANGNGTTNGTHGSGSHNGTTPATTSPNQTTASATTDPASDTQTSPTAVLLTEKTQPQADRAQAATNEEDVDKDEPLLWYFAIGSMMNPVSLNLRHLHPKQSMPGILRDWKLVFRGFGGMGDIDPSPGSSFHGVLHQVTRREFAILDSIEATYRRTPVKVETYDGRVMDAFAYKMDESKLDKSAPDALPGERYLDIIIRGARHYGVDANYIHDVLEKVKVEPRKKREQYRKLPNPPDVTITKEELAKGTGIPPAPLRISVYGKVLQWRSDLPSTPQREFFYRWAQQRYAGQDITLQLSKVLYEPNFPVPTTYEKMTTQMKEWAEELFYGFCRAPYPPDGYFCGNWESIGWLEGLREGR